MYIYGLLMTRELHVTATQGVSKMLGKSETRKCQKSKLFSIFLLLEERFLQNFSLSRNGPEKVQKQGRNERMQEDYPTVHIHLQKYTPGIHVG